MLPRLCKEILVHLMTTVGSNTHAWKESGEGGVFNWLQYATSPLDATKCYIVYL